VILSLKARLIDWLIENSPKLHSHCLAYCILLTYLLTYKRHSIMSRFIAWIYVNINALRIPYNARKDGELSCHWYMHCNDLDLNCLEVVSRSCQPLRYIRRWISRKPLETQVWFQRTANRMAYGGSNGHVTYDVTWPPKVLWGSTVGYSYSLASCFCFYWSILI